jgi:hypothetical protein
MRIHNQCCGSGIKYFFDLWTPGSGWKKSDLEFGILNKHRESYFRELGIIFFVLKMFKFFVADPDPGSGAFLTLDHRKPTQSPLLLRVAKTGKNHLNEDITPPPPHWNRREI